MKLIQLNHSKVAIVDDESFGKLSIHKWYAHYYPLKNVYRAQRHERKKLHQMHRQIMGVTDPKIIIDHINGDTLDNRKVNLRICTSSENSINRKKPRKGSASGYIGVSWSNNAWHATAMKNYKQYSGGYYNSPKLAAIARDSLALSLYGDFAVLNFPELFFNVAL